MLHSTYNCIWSYASNNIQGGPKNSPYFFVRLNFIISKSFHYQNQEKICNNIVTKDPITPQVCRYTRESIGLWLH